MNVSRIKVAAETIEKRERALAWLEQYGSNLTGRADDTSASVSCHLNHASACPGSKEAAEVLSAYGRVFLPQIVKAAIACCRNDIELSRSAIAEEIAP